MPTDSIHGFIGQNFRTTCIPCSQRSDNTLLQHGALIAETKITAVNGMLSGIKISDPIANNGSGTGYTFVKRYT